MEFTIQMVYIAVNKRLHVLEKETKLKFSSMISIVIALLVLTTSQSLAEFVFEIQVFSIMTSNTTDCGTDESTPDCETYLSVFCLREGRNTTSSNTTDCPLGFANRTYYYYEPLPTRYVISDQAWGVSEHNIISSYPCSWGCH